MEATKEMHAEFTANINANIEQLAELFKAYDIAKLGYEAQEDQEKECYNIALATTPFCAAKGSRDGNIKVGDRITKYPYIYLLSKEDFNRLLDLAAPILKREGITNAEGKYVTDWLGIKGDARRALVNFIIDIILPDGMREQFAAVRLNIVQTDKLLNVVRPIVAA